MDALLVIDMQVANFASGESYQADRVISNINTLIKRFRSTGMLIVHIQHHDQSLDYIKGSRSWAFLPDIDVQPEDMRLDKTCSDAYIQTGLEATLDARGINRVFICGSATDFCVDSTVKGSIGRGFDVVVPSDAHTADNRPYIDAKNLVSQFNWNWDNLEVGARVLTVMPTVEALKLT